ncbi:uncharacterized protein ARMOST_06219 [Armillaria ostoyae]|uniref:Nephrocystin 3-like N-terminal domain-containing protein n=1 Tax=Armillaria ostoyae TaxID=47428 RepID=A0A284R2F2_ARMOS|nr:uncharacterized protein ARMOST_06219 [Armillaria ostoyae]
MDPVSLLTGILDLTDRCIQGYNFFQDVKHAPKACLELIEELEADRARLAELQGHVNGVEVKEKVRLSASLQNYKRTLDKLDAVSNKYRDPKFKFTFKQRFKWAWSGEKEIKALCADLKQNSGNFQPLLIQIAKDISEMNKRQEEANAKIAETNKRQQEADAKKVAEELAKRLQEVVKWLEPLNSEAKLREVRERRQPGTCEWLLSHRLFASWYSSGWFLWLNGIPGNGKTLLTSFVIDHLTKCVTSDEIVLYAFADFQDVRSTDVVILLRTLLAQLLDHCKPEDFVEDPDFADLEKTMQWHHADRPKFLQYLIELLGKASAPWKRVFVVIDALDECAQTGRRESIAAIQKLASAGSKMSVFVTSRAEQDIVDVLSSVPTISLADETRRVQDDIRRFIEDKMNTSYLPLARFHTLVRARISSTLMKKANGMFRLVDCQLQSLAEAKFEKEIDEILQNLPTDLNSMYERILQNVKEQGQEAVKRTLWWLVGSHRQLRLAELMEAIMVETGRDSPNTDLKLLAGENLLEMCSSLVRYDAETDVLTLSHASVQDFLFSDYLKETVHCDYHIPSFSFLHRHTTGLISAYLQYGDFQNGPCTTLQNLAKRLEQHPLFVYAASSWHLHVIKMYETCSESGEQPLNIHTFFALSDESEGGVLAQRSRRQVSYFGTQLRHTTKDGSSNLQWQVRNQKEWFGSLGSLPSNIDQEELLNVIKSEYKLYENVGGFVCPCPCAGPPWMVTDKRLTMDYPWRDLSNTSSVEELDYMVYPLLSQGPASLIWDLLHKLPQFKERMLFYFGTPLMISIFAGKLDTVKMLVQDLHVDVNNCAWHYDCNHEVVSPIFLATKYGHVEAVELLLQHGSATVFPPDPRPEWFPQREPEDGLSDIIIGAANYGRADILQILIDHGVDKNTRSSISGNTVLHMAVRYGRIDRVKVLVEAGCEISPRSKGKTPLDIALNQQSSDIVRYLLDKGASFNQCLPQNFEDLEWAVGEPWYPETRKYLVTPSGGGGPKSQQDIEKIVLLLKKRLSSPLPHIIRAILDFAEFWIVTSAERRESVEVDQRSPRKPYISTPPIAGGPENLVRRIVFTTSAQEELGLMRLLRHTRGLYSGSSTWFEAGVESSPGVFMRIQDNVSIDEQSRTHVNVWDYQDAPPSIKEWMSKIKVGDKISVYPRAGYRWDNIVKSVKITVYTSCV